MNAFIVRTMLASAFLLSAHSAAANKLDVCSMAKGGTLPPGKSVSFHGSVLSDGMHGTSILPEGCNGKGFQVSPDGAGSPGEMIRQSVMKVGSPGTGDKTIVVDVDAIFVTLGNHRMGLKITKLKRLVLTYSGDE